jgi:hypothetical protein
MDTTFSPIESVSLEVPDPASAAAFYETAFGLGDRLGVRAAADAPTSGFQGSRCRWWSRSRATSMCS